MRHYLPQQVFFCFTGSYCVFLEVERDQYLAVNRDSIEALAPWLACSSLGAYRDLEQEMPGTAAAIAGQLTTQGLLTTNESHSKPFQPVSVATPRSTAVCRQPLLINALRFAGFYSACHAANQRLAASHTRDTIEFIRNRKSGNSCDAPVQHARLFSLLSSFIALRPFYPRPYLCLFDSLALVEFLARYRIFPTWVFGVRDEPFHAHCWVQHEGFLLNDSVEHVATFTPIMAV